MSDTIIINCDILLLCDDCYFLPNGCPLSFPRSFTPEIFEEKLIFFSINLVHYRSVGDSWAKVWGNFFSSVPTVQGK